MLCDLKFQFDGIKYKETWVNSDLTNEFLINANGGNLYSMNKIESGEIGELLNNEFISKNKKKLKTILRFCIRFINLLSFFVKKRDNQILLHLRNSKVILDTLELLRTKDNVAILYGEAHFKEINKFFKSIGFKLESTIKMNPLK